MADSTKGSFTNKTQCTKEHIRNDVNAAMKLSVVGSGVAVAALKPKFAEKVAKFIGTAISNVSFEVTNLLGKTKIKNGSFAKNLAKISEKISKNATKTGTVGLAIAGIALAVSASIKHAFKEGQIDQKYTDAAKIESQTKNIILAEQEYMKNQKSYANAEE
jgi:hypothetical protein